MTERDGIILRPERAENLADRPDYRIGPMEDVVAGIRKILGVEAPPNDPFAPPPERRVREAASAAKASPSKQAPATVTLPQKPPLNRPFEAAVRALAAKLDIDLQVSPATPRHPLAPPHARQDSRNRGPPK